MCQCKEPTINGEPGDCAHHVFPPTLRERDVLLIDAPGRCGTPHGCTIGVDSHAYHHRLVKDGHYLYVLTRHGGGEERHRINYGTSGGLSTIVSASPSEQYWMLGMLYNTARMAAKQARQVESARWAAAAANKRIQTRKVRGMDTVRVRIKPAERDAMGFSL